MTDIVDLVNLGFMPSGIAHRVDLTKTQEQAPV